MAEETRASTSSRISVKNGTLVGASQLNGVKTYTIDRPLVRPGKNLLVVAIVKSLACAAP